MPKVSLRMMASATEKVAAAAHRPIRMNICSEFLQGAFVVGAPYPKLFSVQGRAQIYFVQQRKGSASRKFIGSFEFFISSFCRVTKQLLAH